MQFNEDVSDTLFMDDSRSTHVGSGAVDTSAFTLAYNDLTNTATISVNGILANGDYNATFSSVGIADLSGNALDGNGNGVAGDNLVVDFFFLQGDADHNGHVNVLDFAILAANFGQSPAWSSPRVTLTYDGTVNVNDFHDRHLRAVAGQQRRGRRRPGDRRVGRRRATAAPTARRTAAAAPRWERHPSVGPPRPRRRRASAARRG